MSTPGEDTRAITDAQMTQVGDLLIEGHTINQICEKLQKNRPWVAKRIDMLRAEWAEHRMLTAEQHFDEALAKLDLVETYIWPKIKTGYMPAVERLLQLYDQRNRLKGLYAATKTEFDIGDQLVKVLGQIMQDEPEPLALPAPIIEDVTDVDD